ncbi:MAG: pilus assembly protein PilP [Pseudomonadota bacterium]
MKLSEFNPHSRARTSSATWVVLVAVGSLLAGCSGNMNDLDLYVDEIKSRPGKRPDPLPEVKPYVTFTYVADTEELRSPFTRDVPAAAGGPSGTAAGPDPTRTREFLEEYPLDSFDMVGTLSLGGNNYGLLRGQDGLVHRVVPGNYVGQNDGRITSITESEITLTEIVSNGIGGYIERDVAIALAK